MPDLTTPPSLSEFTATVRDAFAFLARFGFREVDAPVHKAGNRFQIWFGAEDRFVVVAGEGYGTMASVTLEYDDRELAEFLLVPPSERGAAKAGGQHTQLEQIREAAQRLERYGAAFLQGDVSRFLEMSKPLPPYKKPVD